MLTIDGSEGEGGGQILRTALALATVTGTPFRMQAIRAKREKPGLMRQHLTSVLAAAEISGGKTQGADIGSADLTFEPGQLRGGNYRFAIGTAGSTTLVLQTIMFGLLAADAPSEVVLEGGTHNPMSPPFDFLERTLLPLLARMGARMGVRLAVAGYYPAGGGRIVARIEPSRLAPLVLDGPFQPTARRATATVSNLPREIAERELSVLATRLGLLPDELEIAQTKRGTGPGNVVTVAITGALTEALGGIALTEVFTAFGEKGVPAEAVAGEVANEVLAFLAAEVPVGPHLADQLILPLVLAGGGAFRTLALSEHARTQIETVRRFIEVPIAVRADGQATLVEVGERTT